MKAVCDTCGARYRIPDEKAAGKVLQIRCRKCGNIFKYQGASTQNQARAPKGDWFFAIDGESFGPYTEQELLTRFESGKLGINTHVWKDGFSDWMPVSEHPEFAAAIELSKDKLRRLSTQRPQSTRTTEGSGRFTVDIRRPGATVDDESQAQRDALDDEVDHAFQSLIGQPPDTNKDASDELTPTTPMRVFAAQTAAKPKEKPGSKPAQRAAVRDEQPPARAETIKPHATETATNLRDVPHNDVAPASGTTPRAAKDDAASDEDAPQKKSEEEDSDVERAHTPASSPQRPRAAATSDAPQPTAQDDSPPTSAAPSRPARPTGSHTSTERMSLSERLKMIREQSAAGATSSAKPRGLPTRTNALPTRAPASRPSAASPTPKEAAPQDQSAIPFDLSATPTPSASPSSPVDTERPQPQPSGTSEPAAPASDNAARETEITPVHQQAVAPIPSGPIRQVTQEIDVGDLLDGDTELPEPAQPAAAVPVPSDEDLLAHLSKRKEARARGEQFAPVIDPDTPPYILGDSTPSKREKSTRTSASTPYRLDGVTDVYDDEPPYILDDPGSPATPKQVTQEDITPVGGTAAVQPTRTSTRTASPTAASPAVGSQDRRKLLLVLLLLSLLMLLLIGGWIWLRTSDSDAAAEVDALLQEAVPAPVDRTHVVYARNRALGIVAQARGAAESAAFVASEDVRVANARARREPARTQRSNNQARNSQPSGPAPIEFTTASSTQARLGAQRDNSPQGPSKALFADALRSNVSRSVARCAQRTLGIEGFLPVSRLELSITINPDGTVQKVKAQREAHSGPLMTCISNESQRWSFPKFTGRPTTISHPFVIQ